MPASSGIAGALLAAGVGSLGSADRGGAAGGGPDAAAEADGCGGGSGSGVGADAGWSGLGAAASRPGPFADPPVRAANSAGTSRAWHRLSAAGPSASSRLQFAPRISLSRGLSRSTPSGLATSGRSRRTRSRQDCSAARLPRVASRQASHKAVLSSCVRVSDADASRPFESVTTATASTTGAHLPAATRGGIMPTSARTGWTLERSVAGKRRSSGTPPTPVAQQLGQDSYWGDCPNSRS